MRSKRLVGLNLHVFMLNVVLTKYLEVDLNNTLLML